MAKADNSFFPRFFKFVVSLWFNTQVPQKCRYNVEICQKFWGGLFTGYDNGREGFVQELPIKINNLIRYLSYLHRKW